VEEYDFRKNNRSTKKKTSSKDPLRIFEAKESQRGKEK